MIETRKTGQKCEIPDLGNEIVYGIPCKGTVGNATPPAHEIRRGDVSMTMEVVSDWNFVVFERGSDEADSKEVIVS